MSSSLLRLQTPRLELIAATAEMLEADLAGRQALAEALDVEVPNAWPPVNWQRGPIEYLIAWMRRRPNAHGWFAWYCILRGADCQSAQSVRQVSNVLHDTANLPPSTANLPHDTLIGGLGFLGPPNAAGETEIGFSLLPDFHRHGYGPEAISALLDWAFSHEELKTLIIRTFPHHRPSIRVAEKLGFEFAGPEQDTVQYVLCRKDWKRETRQG